MASKKFFFCGINSVEEQTIKEILSARARNNQDVAFVDIEEWLRENTDAELQANMLNAIKGRDCYLLPSVPTDRIRRFVKQNPKDDHVATVLSSSKTPTGMSALSQVMALINHRPNRYESLVATFASKHIPGLIDKDVTEEELNSIILRDRLLHGGTMWDEAEATGFLADLAKPDAEDEKAECYIYNYGGNDHIPGVDRAVADTIIARAHQNSRAAIILAIRQQGCAQVLEAKVYVSTLAVKEMVEENIHALTGHVCHYFDGSERDLATGMYAFGLTPQMRVNPYDLARHWMLGNRV